MGFAEFYVRQDYFFSDLVNPLLLKNSLNALIAPYADGTALMLVISI
jgi:hypothetical protein